MTTPEQALSNAKDRERARREYEQATLADRKDSFLHLAPITLTEAKAAITRQFEAISSDLSYFRLVINSDPLALAPLDTATLHVFAELRDHDHLHHVSKDAEAEWFSTDEAIATVVGGVVTAVADGACEIYATFGGLESNHVTVTVAT